jgi:D-amino-acid dehydrogenase
VTPDGLPILGPEPAAEGLWYATGHGRNGILLAAITGDVVRRMLDGEDPGLDLSPLRPARFYDW